jgi:hypothetical protein
LSLTQEIVHLARQDENCKRLQGVPGPPLVIRAFGAHCHDEHGADIGPPLKEQRLTSISQRLAAQPDGVAGVSESFVEEMVKLRPKLPE